MSIQNFNKSAIIVAHPDDEILWFSSILDKVDSIIFCYHEDRLNDPMSKGRTRLLNQYPFSNATSLYIKSANVYREKHFKFPVETSNGLLVFNPLKYRVYCKTFQELKKKIGEIISGYQTVFTHNPWGEYGHEEHVQVYRVLKTFQKNYRFNLYFNNYISGKSLKLGKKYLFKYDYSWIENTVNKPLYDKIMSLYVLNQCWTWPEEWRCFITECFLKDSINNSKILGKYDHLPPLNIIRH
jgi:hypothetical protein